GWRQHPRKYLAHTPDPGAVHHCRTAVARVQLAAPPRTRFHDWETMWRARRTHWAFARPVSLLRAPVYRGQRVRQSPSTAETHVRHPQGRLTNRDRRRV